MKKIVLVAYLLLSVTLAVGQSQKNSVVLIQTSMGNIKVMLYNETPEHRDNFLKLVNGNFYDGLLFHRVINNFMIQGGDPESKNAGKDTHLGMGGTDYTLPAEIVFPKYYHKRGALAAARQGDAVNPDRKSNGSQFYLVEGKTYSDSELDAMEQRVSRNISSQEPFHYNNEQRLTYKTVGGTPHLDGQYTVFGEIIEGFDVLQKISDVKTNEADRPEEDVKIITMKILRKVRNNR